MHFYVNYEEQIEVKAPFTKDKTKSVSSLAEVSFIYGTSDILCPVIVTSDLHENALPLLDTIVSKIEHPTKWTLICAGDMAGAGVLGSDGDSLPFMEKALDYFAKVFFVQGNHDWESPYVSSLRNFDGSYCHVSGHVQEIELLGTISGVDGIISSKPKSYRTPHEDYIKLLSAKCAGGVDWLVTHEVPYIPEITNTEQGYQEIRDQVLLSETKCHIFGHSHCEQWHGKIAKTTFLNADGRVIFIKPIEY